MKIWFELGLKKQDHTIWSWIRTQGSRPWQYSLGLWTWGPRPRYCFMSWTWEHVDLVLTQTWPSSDLCLDSNSKKLVSTTTLLFATYPQKFGHLRVDAGVLMYWRKRVSILFLNPSRLLFLTPLISRSTSLSIKSTISCVSLHLCSCSQEHFKNEMSKYMFLEKCLYFDHVLDYRFGTDLYGVFESEKHIQTFVIVNWAWLMLLYRSRSSLALMVNCVSICVTFPSNARHFFASAHWEEVIHNSLWQFFSFFCF